MNSSNAAPKAEPSSWTLAIRRFLQRSLPLKHLLPDRQPVFVGSWVYIFGVIAIAGLIWVVGSGVVLAFFGPQWWHQSGVGHFVNSLHLWSVQVFFISMVLHLWGQYFMASWRDGRAKTWMVGVVIFAFSIVTAFTGFISQQNFDGQWIAVNAKDATNAAGIGSFFNVLNFGQMYGLHIALLPMLIATLVGVHVLLVRMKGVVRPIDSQQTAQPSNEEPAS
ncbi:MAG TPA: cytochrome b N-terminal domain-containing protein [Terriglobales bacterium]|nr:cytochrome b N-terminal domain-containing protein [Terriglobales bacterium]